ncbi:MAG: hypothetical protein F6J97_10880 [Leptolyngbya sp. SIO4C1]|nr:hypothetical protein [Leptolyngbya sp. SIO4C1]
MLERSFSPDATADVTEAFELQQVASEFRQEVDYRDAFERHCRWYADAAEQHRAELAAMQRDIPILHWFLGWRRR